MRSLACAASSSTSPWRLPLNTSAQIFIIAINTNKLTTTNRAPMAASPASALASTRAYLATKPENGGRPTRESAPITKAAVTSHSLVRSPATR